MFGLTLNNTQKQSRRHVGLTGTTDDELYPSGSELQTLHGFTADPASNYFLLVETNNQPHEITHVGEISSNTITFHSINMTGDDIYHALVSGDGERIVIVDDDGDLRVLHSTNDWSTFSEDTISFNVSGVNAVNVQLLTDSACTHIILVHHTNGIYHFTRTGSTWSSSTTITTSAAANSTIQRNSYFNGERFAYGGHVHYYNGSTWTHEKNDTSALRRFPIGVNSDVSKVFYHYEDNDDGEDDVVMYTRSGTTWSYDSVVVSDVWEDSNYILVFNKDANVLLTRLSAYVWDDATSSFIEENSVLVGASRDSEIRFTETENGIMYYASGGVNLSEYYDEVRSA